VAVNSCIHSFGINYDFAGKEQLILNMSITYFYEKLTNHWHSGGRLVRYSSETWALTLCRHVLIKRNTMDNIQAGRNDNHATIKHAVVMILKQHENVCHCKMNLKAAEYRNQLVWCSGSHSNGYDAARAGRMFKWSKCLWWTLESGGRSRRSVTRSFEQNKSDAEKILGLRRSCVFARWNDGIASRITHKALATTPMH